MMITQAEYDRLARQGYNRIPLQTEVLADLETPVSAYLKMAQGPYSYLLESVQGGETVSYTHLRAHETSLHLVCRLLLEKKNS